MSHINKCYTIYYDSMTDAQWAALDQVYRSLPGFLGYPHQCPAWFGIDEGEEGPLPHIYLWASVEPSGLQVVGELPDDVWEQWDREFMARASAALGFPVRDAQD